MKGLVNAAVLVWVMLALVSCSEKTTVSDAGVIQQAPAIEAGVTRELARTRAVRLANVNYRLRFDIPASEHAAIAATAVISFDLADSAAPLQLDFRQAATSIRSLLINGAAAAVDCANEHILLPAAALQVGRNEIEVDFIAGDASLNRNPDFLYTLFVPDRARTAFPLFDQPDLKARFELTLEVPATWLALANAPLEQSAEVGDARREYRFAPSDLISTYLFSFVTGEFQSIAREVNGRPMTMLHRETDMAKVARNIDAVFELHGQSLSWLEDYTGIDYPFRKFDFVLIPEFPYAGMEHVGAIQYRASSLLLEEDPPLTELLNRAQLIAHETAHMWFGNLVTMRWFDDVWTKEVFASFMADKMVNPVFPKVDHALNFLVNHYPAAYAVDRSEGANPIRQALPNLNQAGQLYGSIIYHKAPIMMRQLELLSGEEGLREGLGEYLRRYAYGNASWPDLIGILDARSDIDLVAWSEVWVETAGRPEFRQAPPTQTGEEADGLQQVDPAGRGRTWPQQFDLLTLFQDGQFAVTVKANSGWMPLPQSDTAAVRLFNSDGLGYGLFPAEPGILQAWDRLLPVQKGSALISAYDNLLAGSMVDVMGYCRLLLDVVRRERDPLLLKLALGQLQFIYHSLLDDTQLFSLSPIMEDQLWATMLAQSDSSRTKLVFRYFAQLASSPTRLRQLYDIWLEKLVLERLTLEEQDRVELAELLAIRLPGKSREIIDQQLADIENPDRRRRLEFIAPSLAADAEVRDAFFASLGDQKNRQTERWVSDAVANLHHPSRVAQSEQYLLPSLKLLQEIQVTGDIFFPSDWLRASLGNHHSAAAAQIVRDFLAQRPNYNPQLRLKILQAADGLFRAAALRGALPESGKQTF